MDIKKYSKDCLKHIKTVSRAMCDCKEITIRQYNRIIVSAQIEITDKIRQNRIDFNPDPLSYLKSEV